MSNNVRDIILWLLVINGFIIFGCIVYVSQSPDIPPNQSDTVSLNIENTARLKGTATNQGSKKLQATQLTNSGALKPQTKAPLPPEPFDFSNSDYQGLGEFFEKLYPGHTVLEVLGAYDNAKIDQYQFYSYPSLTLDVKPTTWGLILDDNYCKKSDLFKLRNPGSIFNNLSVLTSFVEHPYDDSVQAGIKKMGGYINSGPGWVYDKDFSTNTLYNETNFLLTHNLEALDYDHFAQAYGCFTQNLNHLVGNIVMKKHALPSSLMRYADKYVEQGKPEKCFKKDDLMPASYRLYFKRECKDFFDAINSKEYQELIKTKPNQYILKPGADSMKGQGIYLVDQNQTQYLKGIFGKNGENCGVAKNNLIVQKYLDNPLLVKGRKFDLRVYSFIASIDPLIVYYRDGKARISLAKYNKTSNDRSEHLTNTAVSADIIKYCTENNATYDGMNVQELKALQNIFFEDFQQLLIKEGIVTDQNWLKNFLRPQLKKISYHYLKMSQPNLRKLPQTFDFYGFDVMITEDFKLYLIEVNTWPGHDAQPEFFEKLLQDRIKIEMAYYRSRMKRVFNLLREMRYYQETEGYLELERYREKFQKVKTNRLEPEFSSLIDDDNPFELIIDENLNGKEAYFGMIEEECLLE